MLIATSDEEILVWTEGKSENWLRQFVLAYLSFLEPVPNEETLVILIAEGDKIPIVR